MWTAEKVREELPDVPLQLKGHKATIMAHTSGRKNAFATVWYRTVYGEVKDFPFAWQTIADTLNREGVLRA